MPTSIDSFLGRNGTINGNVSLLSLITEEVQRKRYSNLHACAAYVSYRGVTLLRSVFTQSKPRFRWLFGLDDGITDPQAIRVAMGTANAQTRLVIGTAGKRFHAKAYLLDGGATSGATLVVGSANLTEAALKKNCEVYAVFQGRGRKAARELGAYWNSFWELGSDANESAINRYEEQRKASRFRDPIVEAENKDEPNPRGTEDIEETLGTSRLAWIVLGRNTGGGNQLDIVKRLGPFLDLPKHPREGTSETLTFESPRGNLDFRLTFAKGMWRFMNLQQGFQQPLRPNPSEPSPYVLVISRAEEAAHFRLEIRRVGSTSAMRMENHSRKTGFISTSVPGPSGRLFGWY